MDRAARPEDPTRPPAEQFAALWTALCDILGSAATATLLRRSRKRALPTHPELERLLIERDGLEYRYAVPDQWRDAAADRAALQALVDQLCPLLVELTGTVVLGRLRRLALLSGCGLTFRGEAP